MIFNDGNVTYLTEHQFENAKSFVESFIQKWNSEANGGRIIKWTQENTINFGVIVNVQGIVEMHYFSIYFE